MTLFSEIKAAGIEFDNHSSDLYVPNIPEVWAILKRHPLQRRITTRFVNQINGQSWLDIPFAYQPFWDKVSERAGRTLSV